MTRRPVILLLTATFAALGGLRLQGAEIADPLPGLQDSISSISNLTTDIEPPAGRLPEDFSALAYPDQTMPVPSQTVGMPWTRYCWEAPGVCHRPLYFENVSLERHGYHFGLFQPLASTAHFAGNFAILPYRLAAEPPCECIYTLGHVRPGTPTPMRYYRPPLSVSGGLAEAGVVTGLIFLLP